MPVALVTGGGSGIGRATALRLLADGHEVVVADVHNANAAETVALGTALGTIESVHADVSCEADVEAAVARVLELHGRLDVMVNNAGVGGAVGPITEIATEDWDYTFAVLMRGVFLGTKHAARAFGEAGGAIVNVSSIGGVSGSVAQQAYAAAKAGVVNLTTTTAVELAPRRIRVNAVAPGPILTPLTVGEDTTRADRTSAILDTTQPWPDHGTPEDVANVIAFLAGPDARFVCGQTITVDGGLLSAGGREQVNRLGDPISKGLVGVSRGTTGEPASFRQL